MANGKQFEPLMEALHGQDKAQAPAAILWEADTANRVVRFKVQSRLVQPAPIPPLPFGMVKQIAAFINGVEAQAESQGVPFPRFAINQVPNGPGGTGVAGEPVFDGNGVKVT